MPHKIIYGDGVSQATEQIRRRLSELVRSRHVTHQEVADAIGQDRTFVSKFLSGERDLKDITDIVRAARFFSVSVSYLIGEDRQIPRAANPLVASLVGRCKDLDDDQIRLLLAVAKSLPTKAAAPTVPTPVGARE